MNKKANCHSFLSKKKTYNFLLTIMRVFILFLCLGLSSAYAYNSYSQTKLTINVENATLEDLFEQIHSQSEFIFFYKDDVLKKDHKVTLNLKRSTVNEILDKALTQTGLVYKVIDRQIVISRQKIEPITKTFSDALTVPEIEV